MTAHQRAGAVRTRREKTPSFASATPAGARVKVAILVFPGVQMLDVAGPVDVFAEAGRQLGVPAYDLRVIGTIPGPIVSSSGPSILPDSTILAPIEPVDTLLVAGSPAMRDVLTDEPILAWLRKTSASARRYGSVCSGAFALASAGLFDGHRVTTHWNVAGALAMAFPAVSVDQDRIYIRDRRVCSSAGVTAGMDLALALVEEDLGRFLALKVASQLVVFFRRPGGQSQFSRGGAAPLAEDASLREVQRWILARPAADHSIPALAERAGVSPRHFARIFRRELGLTPADFVETTRVDGARQMIEETRTPLKQVAAAYGFGDVNGLRRAFLRRLGVTPGDYQKRFQIDGLRAT
jgi:transcriptional regulator GlxA family with amidase domain